MGTLTTNLKLYKPAPGEFVDPEIQLNRNWDILDAGVKRLLEYEYTALPVPNIVNSVDRARFYKSYSNAVMTYFKTGNFFYQDPTAFVSTWTSLASYLDGSLQFQDHPQYPLAYRMIRKASSPVTAEVELTGAVWKGGDALETNINVTFANAIPTEMRPTVAKYFSMSAGNTSADFCIARVGVFTDGTLQYKRYGVDPSNPAQSAENRVEVTGIKYNVEVAG